MKKTKVKNKKVVDFDRTEAELKLLNFQTDPFDRDIIKANADRYTKGNVSRWCRYTAIMYKPKKDERIKA